MKLKYYLTELIFRHPFSIASGSRTSTPVVFVELEHNGLVGYGEAALPPYLAETQQSVINFFSLLDFEQFQEVNPLEDIISYLFSTLPENFSAKAALDIALHDIKGKVLKKPCHEIFGFNKDDCPQNTFTIGMDSPKMILQKVKEAKDFNLLKIKLGGPFDKLIIETIRRETDKPICVDANQGWEEKEFALDMIYFLKEEGAVFIEQPLSKNKLDEAEWLKQKSPIPIIADEAVQTLEDIEKIKDGYHGINIKLMKCGGMSKGLQMIKRAKELDLKILIGCMSESSCGVSAAAQLAPLADWTDLDGPLLISNDPFSGIIYKNGKIILNDLPGNGVLKK